MLKVYDFIITDVDLLASFNNQKVIFPEYSRNIPQISVSKIVKGYPRNIIRLWKCFCEVKKFKKLFCALSCEILIFAVSSHECFSELYWNHFSFRAIFWKVSYRFLTAGRKIKISTTLLSIRTMIIININLFY